jgi:hypothetical protein
MPVALFSGLPGSGKTASLVKRIVELREKEPGRPIFQFGINGLKEGLAIPLTEEMLHKWWELPQGSIVCIDECQEDGTHPDYPVALMPKDRGSPAAWVQRITKVRHYGIDFLLTTQHPANMSAYVRRLVDLHVHSVMRSKGVRQTFTWNRCIDDPDNRREKKFADMSFSPLPKEVFELYKSSSLHTMKVRTPKMLKMLAALVVAFVVVGGLIAYRMHEHLHQSSSVAVGAKSNVSSDPAKAPVDNLREKDFPRWMRPRVDGVPWSAPAFDKLEVQAQPRLYCIADENGGCHCESEQGTRVVVGVKTCRAIVADGLYNPFLPPPDRDGKEDASGSPDDRQKAASPPVDHQDVSSSGSGGAVVGGSVPSWKSSALRADYTPPEMMAKEGPIQSGTGM